MFKSLFGYLMVILFGKSVLVTTVPIDLDQSQKVIYLTEPLSILNDRAALYIHLATISKNEFDEIVTNKMQYPGADTIRVSVCNRSNKCVSLTYEGLALSETDIEAIYRGNWGENEFAPFYSIRISSEAEFHRVTLRWTNAGT